jgi:hypothetical protein
MEPVETQRQNETPRRRDAANARGSASTDRGESNAGRGSTGESASESASMLADSSQDREEEIRRRAYQIYEARGDGPGTDVDDWCAAERDVRGMRGERAD